MNKNGCSTCKAGEEKYEEYYNRSLKKNLVQYDYRDTDGQLFSCVAPTLEKAREKRDAWLKNRN